MGGITRLAAQGDSAKRRAARLWFRQQEVIFVSLDFGLPTRLVTSRLLVVSHWTLSTLCLLASLPFLSHVLLPGIPSRGIRSTSLVMLGCPPKNRVTTLEELEFFRCYFFVFSTITNYVWMHFLSLSSVSCLDSRLEKGVCFPQAKNLTSNRRWNSMLVHVQQLFFRRNSTKLVKLGKNHERYSLPTSRKIVYSGAEKVCHLVELAMVVQLVQRRLPGPGVLSFYEAFLLLPPREIESDRRLKIQCTQSHKPQESDVIKL